MKFQRIEKDYKNYSEEIEKKSSKTFNVFLQDIEEEAKKKITLLVNFWGLSDLN